MANFLRLEGLNIYLLLSYTLNVRREGWCGLDYNKPLDKGILGFLIIIKFLSSLRSTISSFFLLTNIITPLSSLHKSVLSIALGLLNEFSCINLTISTSLIK